MAYQKTFKRTEVKYKLDKKQYHDLLKLMNIHMVLDDYKRHKISNIYYDTEDYKIIRTSIEKPIYKEKLRLRKYNSNRSVFVELKKKYKKIVYKRRFEIENYKINDELLKNEKNNQIEKEIFQFLKRHKGIKPKVYLSYEREAYFSKDDKEFRMTFDFNVNFRNKELSFEPNSNYDQEVLSKGYVLMEVKTVYGYPRWLLNYLDENNIYKTSFSKYGEAYKKFIYPKNLVKGD